jgi:uncharacterized membrane protein
VSKIESTTRKSYGQKPKKYRIKKQERSKKMMIMMAFMWIVPLLLIGAVAYAFGWRPQFNQTWPAENSQTPFEILKARYARGEINREEYEQMRLDLEG